MSELKNCPHCGGKATKMFEIGGHSRYCNNYGCISKNTSHNTYKTAEEADAAWNTRTDRFSADEREALKELIGCGIYHSNCLIRNAGDYEHCKQKSIGTSIATVRAMLSGSDQKEMEAL